ncbi:MULTISPECIES: hypothetical protein [Vibrio]|uniref:Tail fiber protein n=2 Tax=Vibrio harveyi group TaxID=717610 RepID=A0A7Y0MYD1_VIBAL|nr:MULTISPECIES: hypothetical protein [Vibrio]MDG2676010.1 hypothetical protein [Vibrio parahaemolyticus]MDW1969960.1 hypothetical protein [Vibrio sp. 945]MBS9898387.1 hypothetical protein [Vibrio alginolyticus]MDW1765079.1 hypothetical protein [Vibrio sp. Vb2135]MDW1889659.1 hypothetical protein [Vibrio sp. Vb1574]
MALKKLTQVGGSPARKIREEIATKVDEHASKKTNPHGVTKAQVGLGNVPNYPATSSVSDTSNSKLATAGAVKQAYDKGVEGLNRGNAAYDRAEQAETNANKHTDDRISTLIGGAPAEALDTIKELGDALMDQEDAVAAITTNIAQHKSDTSNPHKVTKAQVGLSNVPNYAFTAAINDASDVKFAAAGAVKKAYDLAASKMTQAQADGRYLKLAGGTLTGGLLIDEGASNVSQLHLGHTGKRFHIETKTDGTFEVVESDVSSRLKIRKGGETTLYGSLSTTESVSSNRSVEVQGTRAGNTVPSTDHVKMDGYGLIGNRQIMYLTNGSTDAKAEVKIGVGGAHNSTPAYLTLNKSKVVSNVPIEVSGSKVVTEAFNRTEVVRTSLGSDNSWCLVANVTMPQSSSTAVIEFFGGAGFNTDLHYQSSRHQMILRASNGSPKGLNGQVITDHPSGLPFSEFGWVNTSGDNYAIYVKTRSAYSTNILIRYMCSHTITPYVSNKGATQPAGIVKGRMVTSYTSYNKDLGAINSVDGKGLELNYSAKKTWIGSRNTSYCHMETEAASGFYSYSAFTFAKGIDVMLNQSISLGGRAAFRNTDGNWLRINDLAKFTSGVFFGSSLVRTDGEFTAGSWSASARVARVAPSFYDGTWGGNGVAAFSVNKPDSTGAHWAFASYYDGTNIRAGIQILTNSDGRIRFYTNRRSNYVEVYGGNVYAGSPQSSAAHSLTRKDYVDAKFNSIPTAPVGDIMVGNDPSNTTSGVLQGHVTWHARNWAGRTTESASLMTWVNPTTGFKVVKAGTYYIEFTDYRRVRATGQDDTVSARIQVNNATKITNSCTARDNALATPTAKWVGHLNVNDTVRFISVGGEIIVGGGHFTIRYIKP